ncbi:MAG: CDP-diacylglycerol--glycerol-3-phosphate 3-phosphatidyltransferase [Candidatus Fonsibacter sp.]
MKIKVPTYLTLGRILIAPILVLVVYLKGDFWNWIACILFAIAGFTDFLDGLIARVFKQKSKFGKILDPLADKVLVSTALALLIMEDLIQHYNVIAAIVIIIREILISGLREYLAKTAARIRVTGLAKLKTVLQMTAISVLLAGEPGNEFLFGNGVMIGIILLWSSAILTLVTGYIYLKKGIDYIDK